MKQSGYFESVAMSIELEGSTIVDDETFDQADFLKRIAASGECPKSSCPSPERYMESYAGEAERVYVVTLTAELSGSYNLSLIHIYLCAGRRLDLRQMDQRDGLVLKIPRFRCSHPKWRRLQ